MTQIINRGRINKKQMKNNDVDSDINDDDDNGSVADEA